MANVKRNTIYTVAATVALLSIVGALNMHTVAPLIDYVNVHMVSYMNPVFYTFAFLFFFLMPILIGLVMEAPMWESNTRIGFAFANAMHNARNGVAAFISVGMLGGMVTFLSIWGIVTIAC